MDRATSCRASFPGLINITVDQRDPDEFVVHTAGLELVQGRSYRTFDLRTGIENDGYAEVVWSENGNRAEFTGGKLGALIELRDKDFRDEIQSLDTMTMNFVDLVNDVHRDGMGANGRTGVDFFVRAALRQQRRRKLRSQRRR
jgi:flagellar hook-associated protein 1 FlgK